VRLRKLFRKIDEKGMAKKGMALSK